MPLQKLISSKGARKGAASKQDDEVGNSEDEITTKSPDANEDDCSNDSGCGEEASRCVILFFSYVKNQHHKIIQIGKKINQYLFTLFEKSLDNICTY